jgi:hypothetical protein
MRDECNSHQEIIGSIPIRSTVTEPEAVEGLDCDPSVSEFNSRQSPQMEGIAKWLATGLENQDIAHAVGVRFLCSPYPPKAEIVTRAADNCVGVGAVPTWWIASITGANLSCLPDAGLSLRRTVRQVQLLDKRLKGRCGCVDGNWFGRPA